MYFIGEYLVAGEPPVRYIESDFSEPEPHERVRQFIYLHDKIARERELQEQEDVMRQIRREEEDDVDNDTVDFE